MDDKIIYGIEDHFKRFNSEEACKEYLEELRWNGQPVCTSCGNNHLNYYLSTTKNYKCSKCKKHFNVLKGTIFEKTKIPLRTWFIVIQLFLTDKRGVSSCKVAQDFKIQQRTAWFMLHRIREAMGADNNTIQLSGEVEVDEAAFGGKPQWDTRLARRKIEFEKAQEKIYGFGKMKMRTLFGKRKRGRKKGSTKEVLKQKRKEKEIKGRKKEFEFKTHVLVMTERESKKLVLKVIGRTMADKTKKIIYPHLRNHITAKGIFITDQWNLYDEIGLEFIKHLTVNHDIGYVVNGIHINNAENIWAHINRMIRGTYLHLSPKHFQRYMNEFAFRRTRNNISQEAFFDAFMGGILGKRILYNVLISREAQMFTIE